MNAAINLLLADDDEDDCLFFTDALEDYSSNLTLNIVRNGVELMQWLSTHQNNLPDILFLDLNMPRKNGIECLMEIKKNVAFHPLPVIVFSTSSDKEVVYELFSLGAHYYIRKPGDFSALRDIIHYSISRVSSTKIRPAKENFILQSN